MAAKKKPASPPVDVPPLLTSPARNKAIARAKTALAKKWSLTRAETVAEAVDLAWFLVAIRAQRRRPRARRSHRRRRARETPGPDVALWAATANALALGAWLASEADDAARLTHLVTTLRAHPSIANTPEGIAKALADVQKDMRSAEVETTAKFACQFFARGCARAAYVCQMDRAGAYTPGAVDVPALEETIREGIGGLRAYLSR